MSSVLFLSFTLLHSQFELFTEGYLGRDIRKVACSRTEKVKRWKKMVAATMEIIKWKRARVLGFSFLK